LVLSDQYTVEPLKKLILQKNPSFSLATPEGPPHPSHPILWYWLQGISRQSDDDTNQARVCRIDILVPGTIKLFSFPPSRIVKAAQSGLPLFPYIPALLHKLLAWSYHQETSKAAKVSNDVRDIKEMLELNLQQKREGGDAVSVAEASEWLPEWFVNEALEQVRSFIDKYPETALGWTRVGVEMINV